MELKNITTESFCKAQPAKTEENVISNYLGLKCNLKQVSLFHVHHIILYVKQLHS